MTKAANSQQESMITQLRSMESTLRAEIHALKSENMKLMEAKQSNEQALSASEHINTDIRRTIQATEKRNAELLNHCNELTLQCEKERKLRYAY